MPPPTISVLVDWANDGNFTGTYDDITTDVGGSDPSATGLSISRGAPADFGSGSPSGSCTIVVRNDTGKYTLDNGSSVLSGSLKVGRPVWVTAVYSSVTYGLFAGYLARIVPDPRTKLATLICTDALERFGRLEASVADSTTRSLKDYRGAILDAVGEVSTRRDLADEPEIPGYTGERTASALELLTEIGESTLSRHFVRPGTAMPNWYYYTTRDRHYRLDAVATVTLGDELADMTGYDTSDDTLINDQFVSPSGRAPTAEARAVWTASEVPLSVPAGATLTFWADFNDPVIGPYVASVSSGSPSITLTAFGNSAQVVIVATGAAVITTLEIWGRPAVNVSGIRTRSEDTASITAYGRYTGSEMSASLLSNSDQARALGAHMVFRFKAPRPRPSITLVNLFPQILQGELFEPIVLTFSRLSLTARRYEITGMSLNVSSERNTWTADWQLQEAPEQGNPVSPGFFRLNTSTLDSTARLGI